MGLSAKIVTVSDSRQHQPAEDRSGPAVAAVLETGGFDVVDRMIVPDGVASVSEALQRASSGFAGLLVTTGGTGFAPRDLTPEATLAVIDRQAPGLAEAMRAVSPKGRLSRGVVGTIGRSIVVNTPGSPGGAAECLGAIIDVLPHALALLAGEPTGHR